MKRNHAFELARKVVDLIERSLIKSVVLQPDYLELTNILNGKESYFLSGNDHYVLEQMKLVPAMLNFKKHSGRTKSTNPLDMNDYVYAFSITNESWKHIEISTDHTTIGRAIFHVLTESDLSFTIERRAGNDKIIFKYFKYY